MAIKREFPWLKLLIPHFIGKYHTRPLSSFYVLLWVFQWVRVMITWKFTSERSGKFIFNAISVVTHKQLKIKLLKSSFAVRFNSEFLILSASIVKRIKVQTYERKNVWDFTLQRIWVKSLLHHTVSSYSFKVSHMRHKFMFIRMLSTYFWCKWIFTFRV